MSATLRPLREDEYADWLARTKEGYAESMIVAGGVPEDVARKKAEHDHASLLPDGLATKDHFIYAVEADGQVVGSLWLANRDGGDLGASLFVYALAIDEAHRGRGFGRDAMQLAEGVAREQGLGSVTLNVFGGNAVARGLYTSLGYEEQAVFMRKGL
jgi:ribosomal protein S18 acetylase RimI-like enzyme